MKILVLFSCVAFAAAGWAPVHHHGPIHVPVLTHGGVPQDTPEVAHARAAHLAALAAAGAHAGPHDDGQYHEGHYDHGNYDHGHYDDGHHDHHDEHRYHGPHAYPTTHGAAKVTHDGVPLETPEVAAAKAHHFAAFSEALAHAGPHHGHGHYYRKRRSVYAGHHGYHGPIHIPVLTKGGVPVDTPAVQHARAAHLAALAAAGHGHGYAHGHDYAHYGHDDHAHYGHGHGHHSHGFFGLDHDGRPLDEPVVAHAKQHALAAYHEAAARNGVGHHGIYYGHGGHY